MIGPSGPHTESIYMNAWIASLKDSVVYPFRDPRWVAKLWPLPLIALVPFIGLLALVMMKGWRLAMTERFARGDHSLPELDLARFLRQGAVLWAFTFLYVLVPGIVCLLLGIGGPIGFVVDLVGLGTQGAQGWAETQTSDWLWSVVVYLAWAIISLPVYQAGVVRYALGGSWRAMLNVPTNTALFLANAPAFGLFYLSWLVLGLGIAAVDVLLSLTGIGVALVPAFTICLYYSSTAHELGHLAAKVHARRSRAPRDALAG